MIGVFYGFFEIVFKKATVS